jgi:hypothetical protein
MSQNSSRGLGRLFGGPSDPEPVGSQAPAADQPLIDALQAQIAELQEQIKRPSFVDLDEDAVNKFVAEDAAVIIKAARDRAAKLMEQASQALANAESDSERCANQLKSMRGAYVTLQMLMHESFVAKEQPLLRPRVNKQMLFWLLRKRRLNLTLSHQLTK